MKEKKNIEVKFMNGNIIRDVYIDKGLLNPSTIVKDNIIYDDLDFDNILGMHLLPDNKENYLLKKDRPEYVEYLDDFLKKYGDMFFYSNVESNQLYFEFIIGSKSDANTKYRFENMIYQIDNDNCPTCSSKLKIKPLGSKPTRIDGKTEICTRYLIYCPECTNQIDVFRFNATKIIKTLYYDTKKLMNSIEGMKFNVSTKLNGAEVSGEVTRTSNFDAMYRC